MTSFLQKADNVRANINVKATQKAGSAAVSVGSGLLDLAINTGIAVATRSPWAVGAAVASGAILAHQLFSGD